MIIYVLAAGDRTHKKVVTIGLAYVVLIYFLREADFHRLFTPEHITRGVFYASKDVPLLHKLSLRRYSSCSSFPFYILRSSTSR